MLESFWKYFNKAIADEVALNVDLANNNIYSFKYHIPEEIRDEIVAMHSETPAPTIGHKMQDVTVRKNTRIELKWCPILRLMQSPSTIKIATMPMRN